MNGHDQLWKEENPDFSIIRQFRGFFVLFLFFIFHLDAAKLEFENSNITVKKLQNILSSPEITKR